MTGEARSQRLIPCFDSLAFSLLALLVVIVSAPFTYGLEKQSNSTYHARREALAKKLQGGAAILFAAEEPVLDFAPYRQDEDFYYLTGWTEPGAALLIMADAPEAAQPRKYREVLFLPSRNLRMEKFTGEKLDAGNPQAAHIAGVDEVMWMTELPTILNNAITADRRLSYQVWTQPDAPQAKAIAEWTAATLGVGSTPAAHDVTSLTMELRVIKDAGELALLKKASDASISCATGNDEEHQTWCDGAHHCGQDDCHNDGKRVRTALVCFDCRHGDQLDDAALFRELGYAG